MRRSVLGLALVARIVIGDAGPACADGAFPSSQSVLLPRDRPNEIILGTTFGLVFSEDDGVTWHYSCENDQATLNGRQYLMGPPPDDRIYALSDVGVPVTADGACTWTVGGGAVAQLPPIDVFPDPSDPARVFTLAVGIDDGLVSAYRSDDGGDTYLGPIFTSPRDGRITGIEVSASDPKTVYMTLTGAHPGLAESDDGGTTWTITDIEPGIGAAVPYLAAVDPTDSRKIYLRITSTPGDPHQFQGLAITPDGGVTWTVPLVVKEGAVLGFVLHPNGNLFAVGTTTPAMSGAFPVPSAFRSDDGGRTFATHALPFQAMGLGLRNGTLFAVTSNLVDEFALASSDDDGLSWRTRLRFQDIAGVRDCVRPACQKNCDDLARTNVFSSETCHPALDAGAPDGVRMHVRAGGGCGCGLVARDAPWSGTGVGAEVLLLGWIVSRHRRAARK